MGHRFAGLDPALAGHVADAWQDVARRWRAAAADAARSAAALALDGAPAERAAQLADELECGADLLRQRAAWLADADDLVDRLGEGARGYLVTELARPDDEAWRRLVGGGTHRHGRRTVRFFDGPADPGAGVVVADFFIPESASLFLRGDGRDHADPIFGPLTGDDSRMIVVLDLEAGRGSVQFDETCTSWSGLLEACQEARPIELADDRAGAPWTITNQVDVGWSDGRIDVGYDVLNAITPLGSTDGGFTLTDRGDGAYRVTALDADEYPSIGIYQYRSPAEAATVLVRRDSAGVTHLLPWWPSTGRRVRGSVAPDFDPAGGKLPVQNGRSTLD